MDRDQVPRGGSIQSRVGPNRSLHYDRLGLRQAEAPALVEQGPPADDQIRSLASEHPSPADAAGVDGLGGDVRTVPTQGAGATVDLGDVVVVARQPTPRQAPSEPFERGTWHAGPVSLVQPPLEGAAPRAVQEA